MLLTDLRKGMLLMFCLVLLLGLAVPFGSHSVHAAQTGIDSRAPIAAGSDHSLALKSDGTVVGWGSGFGVTIPSELDSVVSIAAGRAHSLALKSDGTVVAWGSNFAGQTDVPDGLTGVVSIAAGRTHSLALKSDGTIMAWGDNSSGQSTVPTDLTDVVAIATGGTHSLALRQDKTVVAWGSDSGGQSTIPTGLSGVDAIAGGDTHSLALKSDGTVSVWGVKFSGQLNAPTDLTGVMAIAAGGSHSLALKSDGTVVGWGFISSGQESVPQDLKDVVAIAAGSNHALALKSDGTIVGWGSDTNQQIRVPGGSLKDLMLLDGSLNEPFSVNSTSYTSYIGPDVSTVNVVATLADTKFAELYVNNELQASGSAVSVDVTEIPMDISVQVKPYFKPDIITYELTLIEDSTAPAIQFTVNSDVSSPSNQNVVITVKATDAHSGVKRIRGAGGQWADSDIMIVSFSENGSYTFEAEDKAGNTTSKTIEITNIDKTAPTLTLVGSETIELEIGDTYDELGATAIDNVDGDITGSIEITGNVDTSKLGTYTVRYNVTDQAGNQAIEVTREVRVVAPKQISLVVGSGPVNVYADSLVEIKDSNTRIKLPNDLPTGTTLEVKPMEGISTSGYTSVGDAYEFIFIFPIGHEDYTGAYTLTLGADETKSNAAIYYYNEDSKKWEHVGGRIEDGKITVTVNHFSVYGVFTKNPVSGGGSSYIPSNNAQLASLQLSENGESLELTPGFSVDTLDYQLETDAVEISLTLKLAHNKAKAYVDGEKITDSFQVEIEEGDNVLTILVKAEDGTEKKYTLTIQRKKEEGVTEPVEPIEPDMFFTDIAGHWAEPFILQGARVGILKGYPDGTFKPNQHVTRAQAASLIVRALGLEADEPAPFTDVKGYADKTQAEIAAAYQYNIIRGYSDGVFKPREKVTRAQIALMLNRAYKGQTGVDYIAGNPVPFADLKGYDEETVNAIMMLYELGIAEGSDGKYMPSDSTTRAQAAKMLGNFFGELGS